MGSPVSSGLVLPSGQKIRICRVTLVPSNTEVSSRNFKCMLVLCSAGLTAQSAPWPLSWYTWGYFHLQLGETVFNIRCFSFSVTGGLQSPSNGECFIHV